MSRYEEVSTKEDVYAGADGNVKTPEDIVNFLNGWSEWLAKIITIVKKFFDDLKASLNKSDNG